MGIRAGLETGLSPGLMVGPGVQLALRFLETPALELREILDQELAANPVLELVEEDEARLAEGAAGEPNGGPEESPSEAEPAEEKEPPLPDWLADAFESEAALPRGMREDSSWDDVEPAAERGPGLAEFLLAQLRERPGSPPAASEYLIGCLDERGYLGCTLEEAAEGGGFSRTELEEALQAIQDCDPAGVGARDLRECLLLQIRRRGAGSVAERILEEHYDNLLRRRYRELARALKISPEELETALERIRSLRPRPGRLFPDEEVRYISPDLIVEKVGSMYEVSINDRITPRLRISRSARELLRDGQAEEVREFTRARFQAARWMVLALERRRSTMLRVMRCIVEEQKGFFDLGTGGLKAMTLAVVAGRLGLHESTVARVTRSKYVETPRGIYPLRFFFSNRIRSRTGEAASSRAVKDRIRRLVGDEDRRQPLTDDAIVETLLAEGIQIARRTVAKYRRGMGIERARYRRRLRASL